MNGPCIAIDVSKGESHIQGFIGFNTKLHNVKKINHDRDGFNDLLNLKNELEERTQQTVTVIFEATGVYHRVLEKFLFDNHIRHHIVNPLVAAKSRKSDSLRSLKTDKLDPKNLAKLYYTKSLLINQKKKDSYHQLRQLSRYYEDLLVHIRKDKVAFRAQLDIVFPGYEEVYDDLYSDVSMTIIKKYPHPQMVETKSINTVSKYIQGKTCHHEKVGNRYAEKIIEYSKKCYSGCNKDDIEVTILLRLIKTLSEHLDEANRIITEMVSIGQDMANFEILRSIPGIGDNLAIRIIGEIGEISRFSSAKKLVAYAGIDPKVYQSGKNDGLHISISKKGNKRLRCLLYLAITCNIRLKKENSIKEYYEKKKQQTNPLSPKAAKIACANKLLRIIFSMCNNGTMYQ